MADQIRKNLEEKRRRVEELRQRRANRSAPKPTPPSSDTESTPGAPPGSAEPENYMDYVNSLISSPSTGKDAEAEVAGLPPAPTSSGAAGLDTSGAPGISLADRISKLKLVTGIVELHILPATKEVYDKSLQTDESFLEMQAATEEENGSVQNTPLKKGKQHKRTMSFGKQSSMSGVPVPEALSDLPQVPEDRVPHSPLTSPRGETGLMDSSFVEGAGTVSATLTEQEKSNLMESEDFGDFLSKSSKVVERALGASTVYDIFTDYTREDGKGRDGMAQTLSKTVTLFDEKWCKDRSVTDLHWSSHHPELVLASYNARGAEGFGGMGFGTQATEAEATDGGEVASGADPDGLVLVWSLALQQRPEFHFTAQSPVLTANFDGQDPNLIIGGTYSGQVVIWDKREKALPVKRTPLSAKGHAHPVYSMAVLGTGNAQGLVTASTDGKVCFWNLSQLVEPTDFFPLTCDSSSSGLESKERELDGDNSAFPIAVSSFAITSGSESGNNLVVGSESGSIYQTQMHLRNSNTPSNQEFRAHFGMVTSLDFNSFTIKRMGRLLLSSGVDWTTRLWSPAISNAPLLTFQYQTHDYVCDVKWSPKHPALFATAAISGEMSLWNLNQDTEEPLAQPVKVTERCALNKIAWSSEGKRIAVGDAAGTTHIYSLADEIAMPRSDEDVRLEQTLRNKGALPSEH